MIILLFLINFVKFKVLFADFPNTKFWFPEFFSSYAWHVTDFINLFYLNVFFCVFFSSDSRKTSQDERRM